jgi:hypothetical protein
VDQSLQTLTLVAALNCPELQEAQVRSVVEEPTAVTYSPTAQFRKLVQEVWLTVAEKLPAAQAEQTWSLLVVPAVLTYVP